MVNTRPRLQQLSRCGLFFNCGEVVSVVYAKSIKIFVEIDDSFVNVDPCKDTKDTFTHRMQIRRSGDVTKLMDDLSLVNYQISIRSN